MYTLYEILAGIPAGISSQRKRARTTAFQIPQVNLTIVAGK